MNERLVEVKNEGVRLGGRLSKVGNRESLLLFEGPLLDSLLNFLSSPLPHHITLILHTILTLLRNTTHILLISSR